MTQSTTNDLDVARARRVVSWVAIAWSAIAFAVAASGVLPKVRPLVPAVAIGTAVAWVMLYRRAGSARLLADAVDLRVVVLFHAIRAPIGALFLWEMSRGHLPALFAVRAGWGDILAGTTALAVALVGPYATRARRALLVAWNTIGLVDILVVVATANYLFFWKGDETMTRAFGEASYGLLPTLVVPLVIATHLLVFARASRLAAR